MKIAFIGGGNMGTAIMAGVIDKGLAAPQDISVSDISADRLAFLKETHGVKTTPVNGEAVLGKDVIIFSVKPQTVPDIMPELKEAIKADQLVLSIMAGITIDTLKNGLEHEAIVRVMPNTPAQLNEGMSGWTATASVSDNQKKMTGDILEAIGKQTYFDDENYLDMVTAVSGSGPAYFFRFVEAMTEAGVKIGFTETEAYELTLQTMIGAGKLMQETGKTPAELRQMVTSKGGTTAAALEVMDTKGLQSIIEDAVKAAYNRSLELGGKK